jgi:hypothetical protein
MPANGRWDLIRRLKAKNSRTFNWISTYVIPVGCLKAGTTLLPLGSINSVNAELQSRRHLRVKAPMPEFNRPESVQSIPVLFSVTAFVVEYATSELQHQTLVQRERRTVSSRHRHIETGCSKPLTTWIIYNMGSSVQNLWNSTTTQVKSCRNTDL